MSSREEELTLSYLFSSSFNLLPDSCIKLRSYLNTYLSDLAHKQDLKILNVFRNRNKSCPYCLTSWGAGTTTFNLLPTKRKHLGYNENNKNQKDETSEKNQLRNTLVLKCRVCTKKSLFSLVKKKHNERKPDKHNAAVVIKNKKKRKNKKDKSCGLTINLQKQDTNLPKKLLLKKKKRLPGGTLNPVIVEDKEPESGHKNIPIPKTKKNLDKHNKKQLVPNPFATHLQSKISKKKNKRIQNLKKLVTQEKNNLVKKSIKDFLTLV